MTFLFANSSSTLHWKLFEHCVNLDTLSNYSWARAVSAYMNESLTTKAKAKAKKGGEASIGAVSGCTILILVSKQWLMQCILSFRQCSFHLVQCRNGNCKAVSVLSYAVSNLISDISCFWTVQFLLCERTNIIQPILGKEKETPAILKWSLVELHTRFNQIKDLNDIEVCNLSHVLF